MVAISLGVTSNNNTAAMIQPTINNTTEPLSPMALSSPPSRPVPTEPANARSKKASDMSATINKVISPAICSRARRGVFSNERSRSHRPRSRKTIGMTKKPKPKVSRKKLSHLPVKSAWRLDNMLRMVRPPNAMRITPTMSIF